MTRQNKKTRHNKSDYCYRSKLQAIYEYIEFTLEPNFKVFNSTKQERSLITQTWTVGQQASKEQKQHYNNDILGFISLDSKDFLWSLDSNLDSNTCFSLDSITATASQQHMSWSWTVGQQHIEQCTAATHYTWNQAISSAAVRQWPSAGVQQCCYCSGVQQCCYWLLAH